MKHIEALWERKKLTCALLYFRMDDVAGSSSSGIVPQLTEQDIPGAFLDEPLESHTIPALRWWLLCHGIQAPTSWKKPKLIARLVQLFSIKYIS